MTSRRSGHLMQQQCERCWQTPSMGRYALFQPRARPQGSQTARLHHSQWMQKGALPSPCPTCLNTRGAVLPSLAIRLHFSHLQDHLCRWHNVFIMQGALYFAHECEIKVTTLTLVRT